MNKSSIFKKIAAGLVAVTAGLVIGSTARVSAIPYEGEATSVSPTPAFNVFTGVPAPWGNESDFLRARVPVGAGDTTTQYVDPLNTTCAAGQKIQMRVYVHNGASADGNQDGNGPSVAHGTKVKVTLPTNQAASFTPNATISSTNAGTVNDGVVINCNGKVVKLKFVAGSASAYSKGSGVVPVDENLLFTSGAPIRSQSVPGDVYGCWDERVYVILSVEVEEIPVQIPSTGECKLIEDFIVDSKKRQVSLKVTGSVSNAQIIGYKIDFGDGSTSDKQSDSHVYAKEGTYKIVTSVVIKFADGHTETKTSVTCTKSITFTKEKCAVPGKETLPIDSPDCKVVPITTTTTSRPSTPVVATPVTLPNTGSGIGKIMGIFAITTMVGGFAHRFLLSRRYNS